MMVSIRDFRNKTIADYPKLDTKFLEIDKHFVPFLFYSRNTLDNEYFIIGIKFIISNDQNIKIEENDSDINFNYLVFTDKLEMYIYPIIIGPADVKYLAKLPRKVLYE
jgi:hypothetical protein